MKRLPPGIPGAAVLGGLATASGIALTSTSGWLIVAASHRPQILTLLAAIVAVRAFGMARPVLRYAERLRSHDAALALLARERVRTYDALIPLTPARLGAGSRGQVLTSAVEDLEDDAYAQVRVVVPLLGAAIAGVLTVLASALWSYAAAGLLAVDLLAQAVVGWLVLHRETQAQQRWLAARAQVGRIATLTAGNADELAAIGAHDALGARLDAAHAELAAANRARARTRAVGLLGAGLVTGAVTAAMVAHAEKLVAAGLPGAIGALLVLTPVALVDAVSPIPDAMGSWARSRAARERIARLTGRRPPLGAHGELTLSGRGEAPYVQLDDVTAGWADDAPTVVGPVSADLPAGARLALTGPNGSGKSTVLALLATHLDPAAGTVRWDGTDSRDLAVEATRAAVAMLDDEPHVFASTLRENLRLARPEATDADLIGALRRAGLGGWFEALPDGLDTRLGMAARGLSGGERARLGLARALLSDRPVLLLDEPVAHLDHATGVAVLADLLAGARADQSIVMVSHRDDIPDAFTDELRLLAPFRTSEN